MSPAKAVGEFLTSTKAIAAGVTLALGAIGWDGRATAGRLENHLAVEVPMLLQREQAQDSSSAAEMRVLRLQLNALLDRMDASNLSDCLKERNAIVRRELECGRLESEAGINR